MFSFFFWTISHPEPVQRGRFRTRQDIILGRGSQLWSEEPDERDASWGKGENTEYGWLVPSTHAFLTCRQCFIILTAETRVSVRVGVGKGQINYPFPRNCCLCRGAWLILVFCYITFHPSLRWLKRHMWIVSYEFSICSCSNTWAVAVRHCLGFVSGVKSFSITRHPEY